MIFNTGSGSTYSTPDMIILANGNVGIGISNPFEMLCIGTPASTSDGTLVLSKNGAGGNRNFKIGFDGNLNYCIGDYGSGVSGNTWTSNMLCINWQTGNIGIGITGQTQKLYVNGTSYFNNNTSINGVLNFNNLDQNRVISLYDVATPNNFQFVGLGASTGLVLNVVNSTNSFKFLVGASTTTSTQVATISGSGDISCNGNLTTTGNTLTIGNSTQLTTLYLTDMSAAAWKIATGNSNLNFTNNLGGTFGTKMYLKNDGSLVSANITLSTPSNYQIWMYPPTASLPALINTIQQGTGYNQNIAIQYVAGSGNVGIGTTIISTKLHIEHASTAFNAQSGGLYLYNPNNTAGSCSVLGARIAGSAASKVGISLDVLNIGGWSIYMNANDTTNSWLRFHSAWDATSGLDRLQIRGSDRYTNINGGCYIADYTTIRTIVADRSSYNHALAPLTITNQTATSASVLNDSLPVLNLCRQGTSGAAYGARATFCLSRFENSGISSRSRLDIVLANDTYNDTTIMTLRSNGRVGIGTATPGFPLHIGNISVPQSLTNTMIIQGASYSTVTFGTYTRNICAKFETDIWTAGFLNYSSDIRIKKNIQDIDDDSALQKILQIEPKTYNYIDIIDRGYETVYGFIAQQIKEVIPKAVTLNESFIPNIYDSYVCNSNILYIVNTILSINDEILILDIESNKKSYIIDVINDDHIILNNSIVGNKCFVYGTKVKDFHTLNKDYIYTLNVCATQELYRQLENQKLQIQSLQAQINELKELINK